MLDYLCGELTFYDEDLYSVGHLTVRANTCEEAIHNSELVTCPLKKRLAEMPQVQSREADKALQLETPC